MARLLSRPVGARSGALLAVCAALLLTAPPARGQTPCSSAPLLYGFSSENVSSPLPHQYIIGGARGTGEALVRVPEGRLGRASIHGNIILQAKVHGALGWGMSVAVDGAAEVIGATTTTTAADTRSGGFFTSGYQKTEIVLPERNEGQQGAISIFLSSTDPPETLPRSGTYSVLRITLEALEPQGEEDALVQLRFLDGLAGSGQPVPNTAGVDGQTRSPCNEATALVTVRFQLGDGNRFIRGNANGDGDVNLADAIWSFRALFLSPGLGPCADASDVNGDGQVDIADPLHLLNFQLLGARPPPAPYPACGEDPDGDEDGLGCDISQGPCTAP